MGTLGAHFRFPPSYNDTIKIYRAVKTFAGGSASNDLRSPARETF